MLLEINLILIPIFTLLYIPHYVSIFETLHLPFKIKASRINRSNCPYANSYPALQIVEKYFLMLKTLILQKRPYT